MLSSIVSWVSDWTWASPVSAWLEAGASMVAVLAAAGAFWQVQRQISQAERLHRESLRGSLRPVVVVDSADVRVGRYGATELVLVVRARNIGGGPALNIELRGWLVAVEPELTQAGIDSLGKKVDVDDPGFVVRQGSLGAGVEREIEMTSQYPLGWRDFQGKRAVLFYFALYSKVFDERLPSKPRAEWKVGSYMFPKDWRPPVVNSGGQALEVD